MVAEENNFLPIISCRINKIISLDSEHTVWQLAENTFTVYSVAMNNKISPLYSHSVVQLSIKTTVYVEELKPDIEKWQD